MEAGSHRQRPSGISTLRVGRRGEADEGLEDVEVRLSPGERPARLRRPVHRVAAR